MCVHVCVLASSYWKVMATTLRTAAKTAALIGNKLLQLAAAICSSNA